MDQKLDFSPMRVQRVGSMPISSVQMRSASSSSVYTVTHSRSLGIPSVPVTKFQAKWIASRLK